MGLTKKKKKKRSDKATYTYVSRDQEIFNMTLTQRSDILPRVRKIFYSIYMDNFDHEKVKDQESHEKGSETITGLDWTCGACQPTKREI